MILDTHEHLGTNDSALLAALTERDLRVVNVCYVPGPGDGWREQATRYRELSRSHPERFAWCTSFSLPPVEAFADPGVAEQWTASAIDLLSDDFQSGAVACKVWKNIGMDLADHEGRPVMIDHQLFRPVFRFLARSGHPVIAHLAEPLACWQPLSEESPHFAYYSAHPEWHMYGREAVPSHAEIIAARDSFLAAHADLTVIGAHLGSEEHDVGLVARRLDEFPNFNVDIAARLADLAAQDRDVVRSFFTGYHDRILFGTDMFTSAETLATEADRGAVAAAFVRQVDSYLSWLESDEEMTVKGRRVRGLGLSQDVLSDILESNARRLVPGLARWST